VDDLLGLFTQAAKLMREQVDSAMAEHGVRVGQHIVLAQLWRQDGLTPGEIAKATGVATPTVVNTATRMEASGLVVRRADPSDARLVRLHLTSAGQAARLPVQAARDRLTRRATAALSAEERSCLETALQKIVAELRVD
jgi:DNA-binding MarR family transcriptional regulator